MSRRKWLIAIAVFAAYLATWIGGWQSHSKELEARAQRYWMEASAKNSEMTRIARGYGQEYEPIELSEGGARAHVDWCVPVLPGVLIADSSYIVGPLYGRGGYKVVVFYGLGSAELFTLSGWIS
jgi:hypothetical protein